MAKKRKKKKAKKPARRVAKKRKTVRRKARRAKVRKPSSIFSETHALRERLAGHNTFED